MLIDRRVPNLPSGVERYRVPGSGAAVVPISAGDRITVIDVEGRQPCEVLAADASGRVDPGLIGGKVCGIADGLRAILASGSDSARAVLGGLRRRNIDLGEAKAVRLFGGDSAAGAQEEFTAQGSGVLIVAAPGDAMTPEAQDTATEIEVRIARASPALGGIRAAAGSAGGCTARLRSAAFLRARLRGEGRRLYPDRRSVRPAMLGLPLP